MSSILEYEVPGILRPSVHRVANFMHIVSQKHSQMVTRVGDGANYFRWEQLEHLEYWQYFGTTTATTRNTRYFEVLYCGYCL